MTIRLAQGNAVTLDVPPTAMRFEQVKVGDSITATYYDRVSLRVKPAGEAAVDRTMEPTTVGDTWGSAGGDENQAARATVTITGWDPVNKVVSFTRPNGAAYSRRLLDTTDPKIAEGLKVGDRVDVTRTEAVTVAVQPAATTDRDLAEPPHGLVPVRLGQPVQRQDDPGSDGPDDRRRAHQPGRDHLRRGVRPHRDLQARRRLSDHAAHRGRPELRLVQQ